MKFVIFSFLLICSFLSSYADISVIANQSVPSTEISATDLKNYYGFDVKNWKDGSQIVVFDLKMEEVRTKFYAFVGVTYTDFKKLWMKLQLAGEAKAPEAIASEAELLQKVASTPGAIGFISSDKVTDQVKVLTVIK